MPARTLSLTRRAQWHTWLQKHHATCREVWLVFHKKHTGRPSIPYEEAVEEALCFGWIDSIVKRIDQDRYLRKFTPRRPGSIWSEHNRRRLAKLLEEDRVTEAGKAVLPGPRVRRASAPLRPASRAAGRAAAPALPRMFREAFRLHPRAAGGFRRLAPSYRRNIVLWVMDARHEETRRRRLNEVLGVLARNRPLGLK